MSLRFTTWNATKPKERVVDLQVDLVKKFEEMLTTSNDCPCYGAFGCRRGDGACEVLAKLWAGAGEEMALFQTCKTCHSFLIRFQMSCL